jgi:hypothetical protein
MKKVTIEFQYFDGCPNHKLLHHNLEQAIEGLKNDIALTYILVEDEETARRIHFRGSPTLLIDGKDIDGMPELPLGTLSCRFYPAGIPSPEKIRNILIHILKK